MSDEGGSLSGEPPSFLRDASRAVFEILYVPWVCPDDGCCANCGGSGGDQYSQETSGMCWDCQGTGHAHA